VATIGGLPAHILLVHAVVPLAGLLVVLVTTWPAARARLTLPTAVVAVGSLVAVPLATSAGEWLEHRDRQHGEADHPRQQGAGPGVARRSRGARNARRPLGSVGWSRGFGGAGRGGPRRRGRIGDHGVRDR